MSSDSGLADYICDCLSGIGEISSKKLFGEYCIYFNKKVIGLICDNEFFIKITEFGKKLLVGYKLKEPYKGAKPWFLIENFENRELMQKLLLGMYDELPFPKKKKKKSAKTEKLNKKSPEARLLI